MSSTTPAPGPPLPAAAQARPAWPARPTPVAPVAPVAPAQPAPPAQAGPVPAQPAQVQVPAQPAQPAAAQPAGAQPAGAQPAAAQPAVAQPAVAQPAVAQPAVAQPAAARPPAATPPLARRRNGRFVAGVAGGVADHLGVSVLWVRTAFVVLAAVNGAGVVAYGLLWIFVRQESQGVDRAVPRGERQQALGLVALAIGAGLAANALGNSVVGWIVGPLGVAAAGAAVVWREADESQRRRWTAGARSGIAAGGRNAVARVVAGAVFVASGIAVFLVGNLQLGQVQFALLAVLATLVGVAVITVPWWLKLVRDLGEERRERIVGAERAEIAAHLHDSVLQTLALIQRQSDQPREVLRLARGQERELRHWLYGPAGYGRAGGGEPALDAGLAAAVTTAAAEVEDTYAIDVRPVVVGDRPLDDGLRALVLAAREAMVNAAKHAEVTEVSVYVEVEPDDVHVFVRDRGVGFDPDSVPADRHGLAASVHGRMSRHGGAVRLRSAPGEGTEVHLRMPVAGSAGTQRLDEPTEEATT